MCSHSQQNIVSSPTLKSAHQSFPANGCNGGFTANDKAGWGNAAINASSQRQVSAFRQDLTICFAHARIPHSILACRRNLSMKPIARSAGLTGTVGYLPTGMFSALCLAGLLCSAGCGGSANPNTTPPPPSPRQLSSSKLGPHVLGASNNVGAGNILSDCPRVGKWVAPSPGIDVAISSYKSHCPGAIVIVRVFVPTSMAAYSPTNDPAVSANDFWNKMSTQGLSATGPVNQIDWLEGPNELDNLPNWYNDVSTASWVSSFWSTLADLMHNTGYNPLVGSLVSGQPSPATVFAPLAAAMKSKTYKWGWGYHA
jgi:hypothetical protein